MSKTKHIFFLKDDSLVRSQAIQDSGREAAKTPDPGGQTNGSRNTHKSGEKFMCGYVCPCWREAAAENVTQNSKL